MTIEAIRRVYDAQPFQPFVIHLADGRSISVSHREFATVIAGARTITVYQDNDDYYIIDLLLVVDLEVHPRKTDLAT